MTVHRHKFHPKAALLRQLHQPGRYALICQGRSAVLLRPQTPVWALDIDVEIRIFAFRTIVDLRSLCGNSLQIYEGLEILGRNRRTPLIMVTGWAQDAAVILGGISLHYYLKSQRSKNGSSGFPLPPSKDGWPLLGNALEMPLENAAQGYAQWGRELDSNIISASALGTKVVVLNSISAALDLLEKRSSVYSSRPESVMAKDLMGWDYLMAMLPYNERWKERRRLFVQHFRPSDAAILHPHQYEFAYRLLVDLNRTPDQFFKLLRTTIGGFVISIAYGLPVKADGDPHLGLSELVVHTLSAMTAPGSVFVDVLPILKHVPSWFPGAGFKQKAADLHWMAEQFRSSPFNAAVENFESTNARSSFLSTALGAIDENSKDAEHQKQIAKDTAAMFYAAGTDTIVASLLAWIWLMLKHPDLQARVQAELDEVLQGRLPVFEDQAQLPYLMATLMESTRWAPATPLGVPHRSTEDDIYGEYFIPKDTIVIANLWAMLHNEEDYANPASYNPDRFLKDGQIDSAVRDPFTVNFGFGRRACPGEHIGKSMVWLVAASMASLFRWTEPLGDNGKPINQPLNFETGLLSQPKPFLCEFKLRSSEAQAHLEDIETVMEQ